MAKRHLKQDTKQALGQYFTTNADVILQGYESLVKDKTVVDPFAGGGDLLLWATKHGARAVEAYDIAPINAETRQNDSLCNPPDYQGKFVLTNPPYLHSNKCRNGNKMPYKQWSTSDYYKCHLASLANDCDEAIEIIPANFFCESRAEARKRLFSTHYIVSAKMWTQPVFSDTTSSITAIHLKRGRKQRQQFPLLLLPENRQIDMDLQVDYGYLHGADFFSYIEGAPELRVVKITADESPNTRIVVSLLDKGAWPVGLSINTGAVILCGEKSFTTYQVSLPDYDLSASEEEKVVDLFNHRLQAFRQQYASLFLANYMGPDQKILSRAYVHRLLAKCISELGIQPKNSLFVW